MESISHDYNNIKFEIIIILNEVGLFRSWTVTTSISDSWVSRLTPVTLFAAQSWSPCGILHTSGYLGESNHTGSANLLCSRSNKAALLISAYSSAQGTFSDSTVVYAFDPCPNRRFTLSSFRCLAENWKSAGQARLESHSQIHMTRDLNHAFWGWKESGAKKVMVSVLRLWGQCQLWCLLPSHPWSGWKRHLYQWILNRTW